MPPALPRATTVRVDLETKGELDRLQGYVQSETGERLSHAELLRRLIRVGREHEKELMTREGVRWRPPTPEQMRKTLQKASDREVEAHSDEIDDVLYDGSPHE